MGAVKSAYASSEYMLYYIEREQYDNIKKLVKKKPQVLEASITKNTKMTPLYRACFNGDLKMVKFFVEECGADVNHLTQKGESPLIVSVQRNHKEIIRYLLERGADVNIVSPSGLSAIEYAILPGYYEVALLLYERIKNKQLRSAAEYEDLGEEYLMRYVNYIIFLDNLKQGIEVENVADFLTKPVTVYRDPVVDPRETWKQWIRRTMEFKDPPLVERDELPEEMQPQNQRFGKMRHTLSNMTMSPMVRQKPHFRPQTSTVAMSENELRSAPPTNEELQVRSIA